MLVIVRHRSFGTLVLTVGLLLCGPIVHTSMAVESGPSPDDRLEPFQVLALTQGTQFERQE